MSRLDSVLVFFLGHVLYAHATDTSAFTEASIVNAARILDCETAALNFHVKPAILFFAGFCSLWRWGSCEYVVVVTAKV